MYCVHKLTTPYEKVRLTPKVLNNTYLSGQHSGIGRRLISVGFDFHAPRDTGDCLTAGKIRNMNERVVETGEDVRHTEHKFTFTYLGTQRYLDLLFGGFLLPWSHGLPKIHNYMKMLMKTPDMFLWLGILFHHHLLIYDNSKAKYGKI